MLEHGVAGHQLGRAPAARRRGGPRAACVADHLVHPADRTRRALGDVGQGQPLGWPHGSLSVTRITVPCAASATTTETHQSRRGNDRVNPLGRGHRREIVGCLALGALRPRPAGRRAGTAASQTTWFTRPVPERDSTVAAVREPRRLVRAAGVACSSVGGGGRHVPRGRRRPRAADRRRGRRTGAVAAGACRLDGAGADRRSRRTDGGRVAQGAAAQPRRPADARAATWRPRRRPGAGAPAEVAGAAGTGPGRADRTKPTCPGPGDDDTAAVASTAPVPAVDAGPSLASRRPRTAQPVGPSSVHGDTPEEP